MENESGGGGVENESGGGGVEMGGGDGRETESVTKEKGKKKLTTGIGASLTPDHRDKEISVPALHVCNLIREDVSSHYNNGDATK